MFADHLKLREVVHLLDDASELIDRAHPTPAAFALIKDVDALLTRTMGWLKSTPSEEAVLAMMVEVRVLHRKADALPRSRRW